MEETWKIIYEIPLFRSKGVHWPRWVSMKSLNFYIVYLVTSVQWIKSVMFLAFKK